MLAQITRASDALLSSRQVVLKSDHDAEIERLRALVLFLGTRHTASFTDLGWNMTHPVTCRFIPGGLKNCVVNAAAVAEWEDSPVERDGEYVIDLDSEGSIEIGERIEHQENPPAELWATLRDVLSEGE